MGRLRWGRLCALCKQGVVCDAFGWYGMRMVFIFGVRTMCMSVLLGI